MSDASYGGAGSKSFADNTPISGGTAGTGRTFLGAYFSNRLLQNGTITSVKYLAHGSIANGMKFKVFRPNGSNWDFVGESEKFTPISGSTQTKVLGTPITGVAPGDVLGYWIDYDGSTSVGACLTRAATSGTIKWLAGDNTGANQNFSGSIDNLDLCLEAFGAAPIGGMSGDSIEAGHGSSYNTFLDLTGPAGDISAELGFCMRTSVGSSFTYQDYSSGSKQWSWVLGTAMPAMQSGTAVHQSSDLNNLEYWFHCGVNDIFNGRTWNQVQSDLDAIYALCGSRPMFVDEILPDSNFTDLQAATIRTFNTNYAAWAVEKATVRIVSCHDLLGQIRSSTGQIDDLKSIYNSGDGVHPNAAGAAVIASQRASVRAAYYGGSSRTVGKITQPISFGAMSMRRYGSFAGKTVPVTTPDVRVTFRGGGRKVSYSGGGRKTTLGGGGGRG